VTDGLLLSLTVDGQAPGSVLALSNDGATVRVRAEARSATPFGRLEVLYNGKVVADREPDGERRTATIEADVPVDAGGWLASRCRGGDNDLPVRAHTSPVYLEVEGRPLRPNADAIAPLLAVLDAMLAWVNGDARCANEQQREQLTETFQAGRQELLRRCS
jgi:hypothetical protein